MLIEKDRVVDLERLGEKLRLWFIERNYEVKTDKGPSTYAIRAKKSGKIRVVLAAVRALVVVCYHENEMTKVKVMQGSWTENIWSNLGWFVATGGMNLAFSLWSFEVQREFQNYVKLVLEEL